MGKPGWIYLKRDVNTDGTSRGYKFGLTTNKKNRYRTYKTENPSIEFVDDFETEDVIEAERDLKQQVSKGGMRLYPNSEEWVHPDAYKRFKGIWGNVKENYKCGSEYIARQKQKKLDRIERERQEEEEWKRLCEIPQQEYTKAMNADIAKREELRIAEQKKLSSQPVFVEQTTNGFPADLLFGLSVVLALPALPLLYYAFVAVRYAVKGITAFYLQYGIPVAFLAVGVVLCVFIYRYGMNLASERGEI